MESLAAGQVVSPMFKTIGQALAVAFDVVGKAPAIEGTTARALEDMAERRYGVTLRLDSERAVDRRGLNDYEFRAQCKLVVRAVDTKLRDHQRSTIVARYCRNPSIRAIAIRSLRDHYSGICDVKHSEALLAVVMGIYMPRQTPFPNETPAAFNARRKRREQEWSARSIEKQYGIGRNLLNRDKAALIKVFDGVQREAEQRLETIFVASGLVEAPV